MSDDPKTLAPPRHHRAEVVFGVLAFAGAAFLASQLGDELTWKNGRAFVRQPGFMTTVAVVGMLIFGALELFFTWRRAAASERGESISGEVLTWLKAVEYAFWFMAYVSVTPRLGYLPTTLIFCAALALRLGYRRRRHLLSALMVGLVTVLIFKTFLSVKIPGGAAYEMLPDAIRNFMIQYF